MVTIPTGTAVGQHTVHATGLDSGLEGGGADQSGLLRRGDIYINLARTHVALEEHSKARAMLRRGLEEDGQHPRIAEELRVLEEG